MMAEASGGSNRTMQEIATNRTAAHLIDSQGCLPLPIALAGRDSAGVGDIIGQDAGSIRRVPRHRQLAVVHAVKDLHSLRCNKAVRQTAPRTMVMMPSWQHVAPKAH